MADPKAILDREERLRSDSATFRENWEAIAELIAPHKSGMLGEQQPGTTQTHRLYDGTALDARHKCAATLHGGLTPPAHMWFGFALRQQELRKAKAVREWLEGATENVHAAKQQSNHTSALAAVYDDVVTFGPGCLFSTKRPRTRFGGFGGLVYKHVPVGEYVMAESDEGEIDTLFRRFTLSHRVAFERWGDTIGSEAVKIAEVRPDEPMTIVHGVYPRHKRRRGSDDALDMPVASCYVAQKGMILLEEQGFRQMPYLVARWSNEKVYGRSPGFNAYPFVMTLNRLVQLNLEGLAKDVDPALLELQGAVLGNLSLEAAARNLVNTLDAVRPLESGQKADRVFVNIEYLERQIRQAFFNDQLQLKDGPAMTAEEVRARLEWTLRMLGPTGGRLQFQFLNRMLERDFSMMAEDGAIDQIPDELAPYGELMDIDVEYESPLARAQRAPDVAAIERVYALGAMIAEATGDKGVFDPLAADEAIRHVGDVLGIPADVVNDQRMVERMRQARALAQRQAEQNALMIEGAKAAGAAAPMVRELKPQPVAA